jgi:hypothetical protein
MLSQNPAELKSQTSPQTGTAQPAGAVLDPHKPIEVASGGDGTTNDPVVKDTRPPYSGSDYLPDM